MPNLIDPASKPAPPSKPKPALRPRQVPNIRDDLREQKTQELNDINKPESNDGRILLEAESNNNSINGLPQEPEVNAEKPKNEFNRPKPVPRERKPVPLPKVRKPAELPGDSQDGQQAPVNSQSPESLTSFELGSHLYSQVSKPKNTCGSPLAGRRLGISTSLGIPTTGEPQPEPKSPTKNASSPPPKPPRGVPYKGPSQMQHSFTYTQGAACGKGGSLGRDYQRHLPPASWKSRLQEVEEGGVQDDRPRALSDVDLNPEQIKIRDQHRPEPPPKALKPKLERQKSEEPEEEPCDAERDEISSAKCTESSSLYEEVPEFDDDDDVDNIYEPIRAETPTNEESPRNEGKVDKISPHLRSDVVAALKSNVVLRNKPHLRNRKEARRSAPIGLDSDKGTFLSHLKDNWKSQSVKRTPDKKQKPRLQNMEGIVEGKELRSKLAGKKKKGEVRKSTSESGEEGIKFTAIAPDADEQLFDFVAVVSLRLNDKHEVEPYISFQFPPKLREINEKDAQIASIPDFCFPDLEDENFVDSNDLGTKRGFRSSETFSFVLTDITGHRNFGYCRHILVKDKTSRGTMKSEVYCIVSPHGLFSLYSQILDEVERQRVYSSSAVFAFLKAVLSKPMPPPGSQVEVPFFSQSADNATETVTLVRGKDSAIHEHVDFRVLFDTLPLRVVLSIVSCLLLEKRVILAACHLSLLSSCCHGLIALLYPFSWLHTYIPVLPSRLIDMCCLPTPYLLGILSRCLPALEDLPLDDVVIVDLDAKTVRGSDVSGESSFFPKEIQDTIEKELQPVLRSAKKETSDKEEKDNKDRNAFITEVFVCAYIHMVGHFPDFLVKDTENDEVIQKTNFYRAASTKEQKKFLKKFTDTQAFIYLVKQKINENDVMGGLFEKRLVEWRRTRRIGIDFSQVTSKLKDLLPRLKS